MRVLLDNHRYYKNRPKPFPCNQNTMYAMDHFALINVKLEMISLSIHNSNGSKTKKKNI